MQLWTFRKGIRRGGALKEKKGCHHHPARTFARLGPLREIALARPAELVAFAYPRTRRSPEGDAERVSRRCLDTTDAIIQGYICCKCLK